MTIFDKIVLASALILSALFIAMKLVGWLAGWSYWWAVLPPVLLILVVLAFVVAENMEMD